LEYPPHAIALASIYLAGLLATFEVVAPALSDEMVKTKAIVDLLSARGEWEDKYLVKVDDLEGKLKVCAVILTHTVS
jgi:CTD kinase subunit beta